MKLLSVALLACTLTVGVSAIDNGLGRTPPMGWRSWNMYGRNINQQIMMAAMDGVAARTRLVDGVPTSLCDLGYCDVGLDDNWQLCGSYGKSKFSFHSEAGLPIVNTELFPDMLAMTNHAHSLGLKAGWYFNNCICKETCGTVQRKEPGTKGETDPRCYLGDVAALVLYGFDSVKLDGCSMQRSLDTWANAMNATGKPILIENCHWGGTVPNATWCPFNFYRTSGDIQAIYGSMVFNLLTTVKFAEQGLSKPGCWAYPDMLEVGVWGGPHINNVFPGLSMAETRAHFGSWCIVSSPLILSHDVTNDTVSDMVWPIIANKEAIRINQAWAGHSGSPFAGSPETIMHQWVHKMDDDGTVREIRNVTTPVYQYFWKPLDLERTEIAVLLMNHGNSVLDLSFTFGQLPEFACKDEAVIVRDVWQRADIGTYKKSFTMRGVASHDAAFLTVRCAPSEFMQVYA